MLGRKKAEVLVVGAGPVGLLASLLLTRRGAVVEIVDKEWRTGAHSYALALHGSSLKLLEEVGLLPSVLQQAYPVHCIVLYDGPTPRAEVPLPSDQGRPGLVVLRQDVLEQTLEGALRQAGIEVHWNHEVSRLAPQADRVAVTVDTLEKEAMGYAVAHTEWVVAKSTDLSVPWVIGADGHRSLVRRSLGIQFAPIGEPVHYAVFEFKTNADLNHQMRLCLGKGTTDVLWPLPDNYCRWGFQLLDYAAPDRSRTKDRNAVQLGSNSFPQLGEENLRSLIVQRSPWFQGSIEEIRWQIVVRFERRLASSFGKGRLWLAGDAAHMTLPAGMQSMNLGLSEADDLARILPRLVRGGGSSRELEDYDRRWMAQWRVLLGLDRGLQPSDKTDPWVGQNLDRLLACLPASGERLAALL